jgi:hypothetical protein
MGVWLPHVLDPSRNRRVHLLHNLLHHDTSSRCIGLHLLLLEQEGSLKVGWFLRKVHSLLQGIGVFSHLHHCLRFLQGFWFFFPWCRFWFLCFFFVRKKKQHKSKKNKQTNKQTKQCLEARSVLFTSLPTKTKQNATVSFGERGDCYFLLLFSYNNFT